MAGMDMKVTSPLGFFRVRINVECVKQIYNIMTLVRQALFWRYTRLQIDTGN